MPKSSSFDAAKYHDNPRAIARYLNEALSTGDSVLVTKAIGAMVRAQGTTRFARKAGMRRDSLYRTFRGELSPTIETVIKALLALDVELVARSRAAD